MKKILYLMHVHWRWIKQRPHFLAEGLSKNFYLKVFYAKEYKVDRLTKDNKASGDLNINEVFRLPFARLGIISYFNNLIYKFRIRKELKESEIIWLTDPKLFSIINNPSANTKKIIYDCMDDILEFPHIKNNPNQKDKIIQLESQLLKRANLIIASSEALKNKLIERYKIFNKDIFIVNNAIHISEEKIKNNLVLSLPKYIEDSFKSNNLKKISYIGTISEWMNFDFILESLEKFPGIAYFMFGPNEVEIPKHERLIHFGPVEHKYIFKVMENSDALVMPFIVNDLILSVNPVKLYEYIYSCKPSLAVNYPETFKFNDYIYLYNNKEEYFDFINKLEKSTICLKKSENLYKDFVKYNNWDNRVDNITKIIKNKL